MATSPKTAEAAAAKEAPKPRTIANAQTAKQKLLEQYRAEPKVERSLSPLYAPYMGKVIQISINGITIAFPVDGSTHTVPESFADEIDSRRMAVDATLLKSKKMGAVRENFEHFPGELQMF